MKNRFAKMTLALLLSLAMIVGLMPTSSAAPELNPAAEPANAESRAVGDVTESRVVSELTVTLAPMSSTEVLPKSVVAMSAMTTQRDDVTEITGYPNNNIVTAEVSWPRTNDAGNTKPRHGAAYYAEVAIEVPATSGITFASSLATEGLTFNTSTQGGFAQVTAENVQIVSNVANRLIISGSFTLGGVINGVTVNLPVPIAGVAPFDQPEEVLVSMEDNPSGVNIPMTTRLTWAENRIRYIYPVVDGVTSTTPTFVPTYDSSTGQFKPFASEEINGISVDRYYYRPQLTIMATGNYRFADSFDDANIAVHLGDNNFEWTASVNTFDRKTLTLQPKVARNDMKAIEVLPTARVTPLNTISKIAVSLPEIDMTQGATAPTLSVNQGNVMRDVTATYNGAYATLTIYKPSDAPTAVEWTAGVTNGLFDEAANPGNPGYAELTIRVAAPPGYEFYRNFKGADITASWKDGNGLGGTQSSDISNYADLKTDSNGTAYLEFRLGIKIKQATVSGFGDFDWDPAPVIGEIVKNLDFSSIPFTYGSSIQSTFPKLPKDLESQVANDPRKEKAAGYAVLRWKLNGENMEGNLLNHELTFMDKLEATATLYATDAFEFPEPVADPSVPTGFRGPTGFTLPETDGVYWTVNWADYNRESREPQTSENTPKKMTLHWEYTLPARISSVEVDFADLLIGEAGTQAASASGNAADTPSGEPESTVLTPGETVWTLPGSADPVDATAFGTTYEIAVPLACEETEGYAFDGQGYDNTNVTTKWGGSGSVQPVSVEFSKLEAAAGDKNAMVRFTVSLPKGAIRSIEVNDDLMIEAGSDLKRGTLAFTLHGGAEGYPEDVSTKGLFSDGYTVSLSQDAVWKLKPGQSDNAYDEARDKAVSGWSYIIQELNLQIPEVASGQYTFTGGSDPQPVRPEATLASLLDPTSGNVTGESSGRLTIHNLETVAKMAVGKVTLNMTPPVKNLSVQELDSDSSQTEHALIPDSTVILEADDPDALAPIKGDISYFDWQSYRTPAGASEAVEGYQVDLHILLDEDSYRRYFFRTGSADIVPTVGQLTQNDEAAQGGRELILRGYVLPGSEPIEAVSADIVPTAGNSLVTYDIGSAAGYTLASATEDLRRLPSQTEQTQYAGTIQFNAVPASGMNGGTVFRHQDGTVWTDTDFANAISLTGLNDASNEQTSEGIVNPDIKPDYDSIQYTANSLVLPYRLQFATPNIDRVTLDLVQPIVGREPLDGVDSAAVARTTRYRTDASQTTWERVNTDPDVQEPYSDPYRVTLTVVPNHNIGQDDGYLFREEDWPEDRDLYAAIFGENIEPDGSGAVRPVSARVQNGSLVLVMEVDPREADKEINYLKVNLTPPTMSQIESGETSSPGSSIIEYVSLTLLETGKQPQDITQSSTNPGLTDIIASAGFGPWVSVGNGVYNSVLTIRPAAPYMFCHGLPSQKAVFEVSGTTVRQEDVEITTTGQLRYTFSCTPTQDISFRVHGNPASAGSFQMTAAMLSATSGAQTIPVELTDSRYSLTATQDDIDLHRDSRLRVTEAKSLGGENYKYTVELSGNVSAVDPASVTINYRPNTITLARPDRLRATIDGAEYDGGPVGAGAEVVIELEQGYVIRTGGLSYYDDMDRETALTKVDDTTYTFTMPRCPVEVEGRVIRPGDPDPDPTPRPTRTPLPGPTDDPGSDDPTASPSASGSPSSPVWPTVSASPTHNPGAKPTASGTDGPLTSDDYLKNGSFDMLEKTSKAQIQVTGSGSDRVAKGFDVMSGSSAAVRDLVSQYKLPDGLDIQVVDRNGKILASSDKVGTGHRMQLINKRKHVLDQATLCIGGDVTGSGVIGITQLVRLAKAVTYESPLNEPYFSAGDLNGNGRIDLGDMVQLAGKLAKR